MTSGLSGMVFPVRRSRESQVRHQGQMVGRNQCGATPVQDQLLQNQVPIEVNVIKVHEWEDSRIGTRPAQVSPKIGTLKMRGQKPRNQPASPFIEVSEHDPGALQLSVRQNVGRDQLPSL